jgi:hypothetical protein
MEYTICAYHDTRLVSKISYTDIRYFSVNIYSLLNVYHMLDGGYHFINYRQIEKFRKNLRIGQKEKEFFDSLYGYDMIELVFTSETYQ